MAIASACIVALTAWCIAQVPQLGTDAAWLAEITWHVTVPADTPASSKLYIAGNLESFGPWKPDAYELTRLSDGTFQAKVEIPVGTKIEYKLTRGSWSTVEKSHEGSEIRNRSLVVRGPETVSIAVANWAIPKPEPVSSATGDLRWFEFPSRVLDSKRRITVWLPPRYPEDQKLRLPVVYMLDGQNTFDNRRAAFGVEWQADETAMKLSQPPSNRPLIIVAIDNSKNRIEEYTSVSDTIAGKTVGGRADEHLRFIVEELKPWIDQEFRTVAAPQATAIIGSSLGGLFVLHALNKHPEVFGLGAAMSPSLFWADEHMLGVFSKPDEPGAKQFKQRLWLDIGTQEGKTPESQAKAVELTKQLHEQVQQNHAHRMDIRTTIDPEARHHESAWARRLPSALEFLFPRPLESETK
jgi:predicted alpha/beta superfamily hydrolase